MFKIIKFAMKPIHVNNIHVFRILSELLCALSTTSYDVVTLLKMGGGGMTVKSFAREPQVRVS